MTRFVDIEGNRVNPDQVVQIWTHFSGVTRSVVELSNGKCFQTTTPLADVLALLTGDSNG